MCEDRKIMKRAVKLKMGKEQDIQKSDLDPP